MKKIAILSDTHAYWDERYIPYLEVCDEIWHAGDIGSAVLAQQLDTIGPLRAVHGNCDGYPLRYNYGPHLLFELEQVKVLITHIGGYPGHYDSTALDLIKKHKPNLFVCGHSHIAKVVFDKQFEMLCINPGAAGKQGFHTIRTLMRLELNEGSIKNLEVIELGKTLG
ncbi:MAG: metallophosphoesterase family protein [Bacteroidales bacterium]|nr:metallophosphoesterase family protein [Bacteroidales bacterium]MDD3430871.1 metallophosphoesterase family protein [Bacteroidales bacterium]MDD4361613.1 metallophosphoesterase family protein [Bacteroidales bacterium]MDD4430469.1 metallophosphoesterase family protein [Bacteroidales bacterium]